jgi:hypothetical protein
MTVVNHDLNDGRIADGVFEDQTFYSAGADTYLDNTLVALDTSTLNLVPYVKGGSTNGNGVVYGVMTKGITVGATSSTPIRVMVGGRMVKDKVVIHADGDASNIDNAVKILCHDKGLALVDSLNLHTADNS